LMIPAVVLGGSGEDTDAAGVPGPSTIGFASSREW
jgi:hypothetical protein